MTQPEVRGNMRGISESESSDDASEGSVVVEVSLSATPPEPNGDTTNCDFGKKASASIANGTRLERQLNDNAFGIAYKPCGASSQQGYDLPSGPAFVDEDEFDQEMGAEFRVPGFSHKSLETNTRSPDTGGNENMTMIGDANTDDFFCDNEEGTAPGAHQQPPECALQASGSVQSYRPSNRNNDTACRSGSNLPENTGLTPPSPHDLELDNQDALKQLTEQYKQVGPASQHVVAPLLDHSPENGRRVHLKSNMAAEKKGVSVDISEDVRQYPVAEEEDEEDEEDKEEGQQQEQQEQEPRRDDKLNGVENSEITSNPYSRGESQAEKQSKNEDEDENARRARIAKEWEAIDQLRTAENSVPMEKGVGDTLRPISIDERDSIVQTKQVLCYFRSQDLTMYKNGIVSFQPPENRFHLFRRAPKLKFPDGEQLRDEVFLLAQIKYTPSDVMHRRLIQTIYRRMTKDKRACPDEGPHWDVIGFQGTNPCTDLNRSMGIFALIQVLYLLETQLQFAMVLYRLSLADITGWPFLCVSIGFTKEAVGVLRRGRCYSECNRRASVLDVVHELHQAQFHAFRELCRREPATHHALHLAKVRERMEAESHELVKAYRTYISEQRQGSARGVVEKNGGGAAGRDILDFSRPKKPDDELGTPAHVGANQYLADEATPGG